MEPKTITAASIPGVTQKGDNYELIVSTAVYSIEAVKKAAYKFADRATVMIRPETDSTAAIVFSFAGDHSKQIPDQVISDFLTELLDQDLREVVKKETEPLRRFLIAHAFSRTTLIDQGQPE